MDEILARYYMKMAPGKYKLLDEGLGKEVVGVGFRKNDKEFADRIDKALDEMKKDGTAKKISENGSMPTSSTINFRSEGRWDTIGLFGVH